MRTTALPPHLAAQTFASQAPTRPQAAPSAASAEGFEALALKSANPARIIAPRPLEPKPAPTQASAPQDAVRTTSPGEQLPTPDRLLRPGARLDIRV